MNKLGITPPPLCVIWASNPGLYCQAARTVAAEVDHDVGLSVHEAREGQRGHVAPHLEGSEEGVVDGLLVQVRAVAQDPEGAGIKTWWRA